MSELKIYVRDYGWSGANVLVTADPEHAKKTLIDTEIEQCERMSKEHQNHYYVKTSNLYEPDRYNPHTKRIEYLKRNRDTLLFVCDIEEGAAFSTDGEG